ncbi:MAG: Peptide-methionine (R)-S-oxide reductase MsrB [uncultured Sphingomonas sp.]|uniref:peptide-methionine (R)-S-oxide reductase n=1 Tax=uncultured Sphingomonas sp. TaxID=158754 RepID=A0A6J4SUC6_9SPHN|nr:MAG: Peptide-methionine (R)-S-oxide reductase MsrB [uncultured Sphingomonas sp.]
MFKSRSFTAAESAVMNRTMSRRTLLGSLGLTAAAALTWRPQTGAAAPGRYAVQLTPAEWKRKLGPQRFRILREAGTERPFSSALNKEHRRGLFSCAGCGQKLFSSAAKFDSGTGWPSYFQALPGAVVTTADRSMLMTRTEVVCARCGGHLGHVFDDGPRPTGKRFCMNGLALAFAPA